MERNSNKNNLIECILNYVEKMQDIESLRDSEAQKEAIKPLCEYNKIGKIELNLLVNRSIAYNVINKDVFLTLYDSEDINEENFQEFKFINAESNDVIYKVYSTADCLSWNESELRNIHAFISSLYIYHGQSRIKKLVNLILYEEPQFHMPNMILFIKTVNYLVETESIYNYAGARFNIKGMGMLNKKIGRSNGDTIMIQFIEKIKEAIGETGLVSRLGGDNFVCLFEKKKLAEVLRILNGVTIKTDIPNNNKIRIITNAGIVICDKNEKITQYNFIENMNIAYKQAREGKEETDSNYVIFDDRLKTLRRRNIWFRENFDSLVKNGEFITYYQPKVDANTNTLIGAEALCRWYHKGQIFPPADFIAIAEENGLICTIDLIMLENACRDIRRWLDNGIEPVKISVNLSRLHIGDEDLLDTLLNIIDEYKVPYNLLEVELTETVTDVNFNDLHNLINKLKEKGIGTAIDDFGVGYSSLNLISDLPWDTLKIDRKFLPTGDSVETEKKKKILNNIINMVKELDIECIVEGVETTDQVEYLKEKDCSKIQGYFYDRPLPIEQFEERLNAPVYNSTKTVVRSLRNNNYKD